MDKDFQQHEASRAAIERKQDTDDFNNEMSGRHTGRMQRFGFEKEREQIRQRKEREDHQRTIIINAAYMAKYNDLMNDLTHTENILHAALDEAAQDVSRLRKNAASLEDGTKVFKDKDGNVYDENGRKLSDAEASKLDWPDGATSWEDFKKAKERLERLDKDFYRLEFIRSRMEDKDNPPSQDDLDNWQKEVDAIRDNAEMRVNNTADLEVSIEYDPTPQQDQALDLSGLMPPVSS